MSFWSTRRSSEAGFRNVTVYNFAVMFSKTCSASVLPEQKAKNSQFTGPLNVFWIENSCIWQELCYFCRWGGDESRSDRSRQREHSTGAIFLTSRLYVGHSGSQQRRCGKYSIYDTHTHSVCLLELQLMIIFYIWELHKNEKFALAVVTYHQFIYKNCSSKIHF